MRSDIVRQTARTMTREGERGSVYAGMTVAATRRAAIEDKLPAELVEAVETELIESGRAARSFALESLTDAETLASTVEAEECDACESTGTVTIVAWDDEGPYDTGAPCPDCRPNGRRG